ncbi:hypothetical protein F4009_18070, partial [Candidatus Poribacteria bacterium]|nr:hypothetical protein [Candidatus Poribacteria bacterium]MYK95875.1 hypothetical protein [Candidatus Poribacteria bacterium]
MRNILRKRALILLLGLALCLPNGVADEAPVHIPEFPTTEGDEYIQGTEDIIVDYENKFTFYEIYVIV